MQFKYIVSSTLLLASFNAYSYPVEDFLTENGTWMNFAQIINTVSNTAHQVEQGYQEIALTQQQLKNFSLKDVNNMSSAMEAANKASKLGKSITYTSSDGINKINDWTAGQDDPKGRLSGLTSVMDTAKATLAVAGKQSEFLKKEVNDVSRIGEKSSAVTGQTQAAMAGDQLMAHLNAQMQSVNTTLNQQNALAATEAAHRAAVAAQVTGNESKISDGLRDLGTATYSGTTVPTSPPDE
jgi:conjugal transfer/entry exclusion protein